MVGAACIKYFFLVQSALAKCGATKDCQIPSSLDELLMVQHHSREVTTSDEKQRPGESSSSATAPACQASKLPPQLGTIGDAAVRAMEENNPDSRYFLWDDSRDASFRDSGFIVQMPVAEHWGMSEAQRVVAKECKSGEDCDTEFNLTKCNDLSIGTMCPKDAGKCHILSSTKTSATDGGKKLCIGDNDVLVDHFYNMIIQAQTHVDITSLDSPTGRFVPAIRNALIFLDSEQRNVRVRMLFGNVIKSNEFAREIMDRMLPKCLQHVEVNVGTYRVGEDSWNHGKIVAVDGKHLSYGGINLYPTDYLQKDNVYDITIHGTGTMAITGHGYANALWNTVVSESSWGTSQTSFSQCLAGASQKKTYGTWDPSWPTPEGLKAFPPCSSSSSGGVRVIPAARLGEAYLSDGIKDRNPSDHAFATMFAEAKSNVKISSQDFGPLATVIGFHWIIIDALSTALVNGVDVYIVFSNPYGGPSADEEDDDGYGAYGYGWTAADVIQRFRERADDLCYAHGGSICSLSDDVLCQRLHVTYISAVSGSQTWENGHRVGNHGKFFAIDDQAFYVGSQNLYKCNLAEFGVIVDDVSTTAEVIEQFWNPMWSQSVAISTSGGASSCCWRTASGLPERNAWWAKVPQPLLCDFELAGPSVPWVPGATTSREDFESSSASY